MSTSHDEEEGSASAGSLEGGGDEEVFLAAPRPSQSLTNQLKRNAFLEGELEKLLDDIDRYEAKLDDAEDEIDQLLFEKKKLQLTLDNLGFRRTEFESLKQELDEARDKIVNQQQLLDEQEQQIEEQDQIIDSMEKEFKNQLSQTKQQRISNGRKSAIELATAKKEMQIAMLQAELDAIKNNPNAESAFFTADNFDSSKIQSFGSGASSSPRHQHEELKKALESIDQLEKEKEELMASIAVWKDSGKELQEKYKKSQKLNKELEEKVSTASERSHEWKRRAESAEKKLGPSRSSSSIGDLDSDDEKAAADEGDDAPQALLLQSAISRSMEKTNANKGWGLPFGFGNHNNQNNSTGTTNQRGGQSEVSSRSIFSQASDVVGSSVFGTPSTAPIMTDDSDLLAMKQINKSLKDDNRHLRKNLEKIEKAHKKEQAFNQKLIVKLQKENDKLNKKIDASKGSSSSLASPSSGRSSGGKKNTLKTSGSGESSSSTGKK